MFPHFAYAFHCLVVGEYAELGSPKVAVKAFESPNDAADLQIQKSPVPFRVQRIAADVCDGFRGTICLLLFGDCAKPVDVSVAVHVERTWAVGDSVPIGENQDQRSRKLRRDSRDHDAIAGVDANLTPFRRSK